MTTVEELLSRAKRAIEAGEMSMQAAAEDIAAAQKQGATQRQIAGAIGKSAAWVNRLLGWRESGYSEQTAFGPSSKAARQRGSRVQAAKHRQHSPMADETSAAISRARAEAAEAEAARAKAEARKAKDEAARAKAEARAARENLFRAQCENYTIELDHQKRDRLVKLLGMLGSNHDGERANAAKKVEQHRVILRLTWDELVIPATIAANARAA